LGKLASLLLTINDKRKQRKFKGKGKKKVSKVNIKCKKNVKGGKK
jgi:hypothetical protein